MWNNFRAPVSVACKNDILWSWAVLSLLHSTWEPWLWTHESQVHVCLASDYFVSHCGLIQILGISRRVEWKANLLLVSSATHSVSGKQAPVGTSSPCLVCYCTCRDSTDGQCECWGLRNHSQVLNFTFGCSDWHREEQILGIQKDCQLWEVRCGLLCQNYVLV